MARTPRPWQRKSTGAWFYQKDGKQIYLGKDKAAAFRKYRHDMDKGATADLPVKDLVAKYWYWLKQNRGNRTPEPLWARGLV